MNSPLNSQWNPTFSPLRIGLSIVALAIVVWFGFTAIEIVDASDVVVIQYPWGGTLRVITEQGPAMQWGGTVTRFPKLDIYEFEAPVVFNDAGSAVLHGSIQWEMPLDAENVRELKAKYGSADAIREGLVNKVVDKCVYMTGPLMSSAESYATKKTDLIRFIEDQITKGVYKTVTREDKTEDPLSGKSKSVKLTEIKEVNGVPERQEEPVLEGVGITTSNLTISEIRYSEQVLRQIAEQQAITMQVQTAIADARKAEQNYITITKNGEANAAEAKWKQEVLRARAVTEAQQQLDVAKLAAQAAEQYKRKQILEGEGDAAKRRLAMQADNALEIKLKYYKETVIGIFENLAKVQGLQITPQIVMGGSAGTKGNAANDLIDLLTAKTARDMALDVTPGNK